MTLIADNVRVLRQGIELLEELDADLYAKSEPLVSSSGIGSHVRHVLDYYDRFLSGLADGRVDYDQRARDERVEKDVSEGLLRLRELAKRVEGLRTRQAPEVVHVKMDAQCEASAPWTRSSFERELQFQLSHAVHHFALIAVILRLNGWEPEEGFGVAPSTLRYWKETRVCAP
jgi:hypothetical protein